jgi:RimJ/RimL family protein N-acetyltransferase
VREYQTRSRASSEAAECHEEILFAIRKLGDNQLIGMCAVKDIRWQSRHCEVWIGIGHPAMRGQGLGTDAMRVLVRYAFMEMNMNRVGLVVASYNDRAQKSYLKVGFKEEGRQREYIFRDGVYYDMIQMGLLRSEWNDG